LQEHFPQLSTEAHWELKRIFAESALATIENLHYRNRLGEDYLLRLRLHAFPEGIMLSGENLLRSGQSQSIYHPSSYDTLTGILLRDQLLYHAKKELLACLSQEVPSALLMIDLDRFKAINDQEGHLAGDRILRETTNLLSKQVRYRDILGRYGGDEIGLFLPAAEEELARETALRILGDLCHPTASIGIALLPKGKECSFLELLDLADRAMYLAKGRGGNDMEIKSF